MKSLALLVRSSQSRLLLGDHLGRAFKLGEKFQVGGAAFFSGHRLRIRGGIIDVGGHADGPFPVLNEEIRHRQQIIRDFQALRSGCVQVYRHPKTARLIDSDIRDIDIAAEVGIEDAGRDEAFFLETVETGADGRPAIHLLDDGRVQRHAVFRRQPHQDGRALQSQWVDDKNDGFHALAQ